MNRLTRKLELFGPLPEADKSLLDRIVRRPRSVPADQDIASEGAEPSSVKLVVEGFACRYKMLKSGARQIVGFLLPGDFCDLHVFILGRMDHGISALTPALVVDIPRETILEMTERPALSRALWWATLVDEGTLRAWLLNIGQRDGVERVAHLLCELHLRLSMVGLVQNDRFALPITQTEIADAVGLTPVHVIRSLQTIRAKNLIVLRQRELVINDIAQLRALAEFNPNYLHLHGGHHDHP